MKAMVLALALLAAPALADGICVPAGQWRAGTRDVPATDVIAGFAKQKVVLLGEQHAKPAIHAWQAATIRALLDAGKPVVIGIEYLPRSMQPVLDEWVAGKLTPEEFFTKSRWAELWKHDFNAYRPIFDLAKEKRVPMVALNIDRAFVRAVGKEGYDAAAAAWPGGAPAGKPAPPQPAYAESLKQVFLHHAREASPEAIARFVDAQTVWDSAFAEGLAGAQQANPNAVAVGVMGQGHVEQGYGVAHQLRARGVAEVATAATAGAAPPCETPADAADYLFGIG